jgi:hypothetical protein
MVDGTLTARGIERLAYRLRVARDHREIGAGGLIGLGGDLLPIAQRAERNMKSLGELFLGQTERLGRMAVAPHLTPPGAARR